jgi:hypothetical protein
VSGDTARKGGDTAMEILTGLILIVLAMLSLAVALMAVLQ